MSKKISNRPPPDASLKPPPPPAPPHVEHDGLPTIFKMRYKDTLTIDQLAEALYEGTGHLQNLAEKLARQHGKADALSFYGLMGDDIQNFWRGIAKQLIDHAKEWDANDGSACCLSVEECKRLRELPRVLPAKEFGEGEGK